MSPISPHLKSLQANQRLYHTYTSQHENEVAWRDRYDRVSFCFSQMKKIMVPEVSRHFLDNIQMPPYPNGAGFALCLTHDIDMLFPTWPQVALQTVKNLKAGRALAALRSLLGRAGKRFYPYLNFQKIMGLEESYGAKSSFYFMVEEQDQWDYHYKIESIGQEIRAINQRGWEVGLHGSHGAFDNPEKLKTEKKLLETVLGGPVVGYRNHFLRFKAPDTWRFLSQAGFLYDTTFGYHDCFGFRNGICHPFHPFHHQDDSHIDIVEIPLVIMDASIDNYMRLTDQTAWEMIKHFLDVTAEHQGAISILWHNNQVFDESGLYEKILAYGKSHNAWMTSGREIAQWWCDNTPLVYE